MGFDQSIDEILHVTQIAIHNALANDKIQTALSEFGYTSDRIQQGNVLYEAAVAAQHTQQARYGDQMEATAQFNQQWESADESYMRFVKVARVAFKDNPGVARRLGLNGSRKKNFDGWLNQAKQFYTNLLSNPDLLSDLVTYGITSTKLEQGQTELTAVESANFVQANQRGEAQASTKARDVAMDALKHWFSDFVAIARIALEDDPQLIESLGMLEPS